ncbi:MAG TPA: acetate/propionate family kinase [bacterium]|nr:acetate/propionate family kinase [bacterium]
MASHRILAVNVGSSSLRLDVWDIPGAGPRMRLRADRIGAPRAAITEAGRSLDSPALADHTAAFDALFGRTGAPGGLSAVGHRMVHGGAHYREPVWVNEQVLRALDDVAALVPLHMPPALAVIRHVARRFPGIPQAAVFDTAFHATLPPHAFEYAVPAAWRACGIRRFGFHGLACADAVAQLGPALRRRAVLLHLGAGCSATTLLRGRSIDTTMGLTPLEGLVMATRCGDLDPAVPLLLQRRDGWPADRIEHALNHESGLLGLSAVSGDMQTLLEQTGVPAVRLALDVFCYRAAKAAGAMAVALGGCEQLIFTGGIGEHAAPIRAQIVAHLAFLGARLNAGANAANASDIGDDHTAVSIRVVRIDEERQIAEATARLCLAR